MAGTNGSTIIQSALALNPKLAAIPENYWLIYSPVYAEFVPVKHASDHRAVDCCFTDQRRRTLLPAAYVFLLIQHLYIKGKRELPFSIWIESFLPFTELLHVVLRMASMQMTGYVLRSLNSIQISRMKISRNGGLDYNIKWSYKPSMNDWPHLGSEIRCQPSTSSIILVSSSTPWFLRWLEKGSHHLLSKNKQKKSCSVFQGSRGPATGTFCVWCMSAITKNNGMVWR